MPRAASRDRIYHRRRYAPEVIELCVRWYLTYKLSYRDLAAMMAERNVAVTHTTIMRWVHRFVPEFERRWARFAKPLHCSWRMDETAVSVRGRGHYLYRAVDRNGKSVHSLLCRDRTICSAQDFFRQATQMPATGWPEIINPGAIEKTATPLMHQISEKNASLQPKAKRRRGIAVRYVRKVSFGRGLYLLVMPSGARYWRYRYHFEGREKMISLGSYPDVSTETASVRHKAARKLLAIGVNPVCCKETIRRDTWRFS